MPRGTDDNGASDTADTGRAGIITAVKTPLGFFALVVLAIEALLGVLAARAEGHDATFLIRSVVAILLLLVVIVAVALWFRPDVFSPGRSVATQAETGPGDYDYEVFIAAPMAACNKDQDYDAERARALMVRSALREHCGYRKVFYAGQDLPYRTDFEEADKSLIDDFESLRSSRYFVLICSRKVSSSVFVEAGAALALGKPSIYHVRHVEDLPFLLREAAQARSAAIPPVKIYQFANDQDLVRPYKTTQHRIFNA